MTMNINRELDKKYNCKRIYRLIKEEAISSYVRFYTEERLQKNLREQSSLEYRKLKKKKKEKMLIIKLGT